LPASKGTYSMACNNKVLRYNSHGKEYEVPRVCVSSIDELQRGDHITFHRLGGSFWHHAIVEDVDTKLGEIHVIEYSNTAEGFVMDNCIPPKSPAIAKVVRNKCRFQDITVYRMIHEQCFDTETVICRAQSELGEGKYNPITNNCEHLAMRCKTGRSSSDQVNKAKEMVGEQAVHQSASQAGLELARAGGRTVTKKFVSRTASQAGKEFARAGTQVAVMEAVSEAGEKFIGVGIKQGIKQSASSSNPGNGLEGALGLAGGALITLAIEGVSMKHDLNLIGRDLQEGRINRKEYDKAVFKRATTGSSRVVCSTAGAAIGQVIFPVPVVGGIIGGIVGGVAGSFAGNVFGNVLSTELDSEMSPIDLLRF